MQARPPSFDARGDTPGSSNGARGRAQTTLDFAVGMSVFLLAVAFVFSFVPGILQPFESGAQEETVVADRVSSQLAQGMLGSPSDPYLLETGCTVQFFDRRTTEAAEPGLDADSTADPNELGCQYDESLDLTAGATLQELVGVSDRHNSRIRLRGDVDNDGSVDLLCWDQTGSTLVPASSSDCDTPFEIGTGDPDTASSVVTAQRKVTVDDQSATLLVEVW